MSQRVHNAPIGRNSLFLLASTNHRSEAARAHLVAWSTERVYSCCRESRRRLEGVASRCCPENETKAVHVNERKAWESQGTPVDQLR